MRRRLCILNSQALALFPQLIQPRPAHVFFPLAGVGLVLCGAGCSTDQELKHVSHAGRNGSEH